MSFTKENWAFSDYEGLIQYLKDIADDTYREFNQKLIPGAENMIGVRIPQLRAVAKEIARGNYKEYLQLCKQQTYEEIMLEGIVIGLSKESYNDFTGLVDGFADKIDNWAVCDCFCGGLKEIKKCRQPFFAYIEKYLCSDNPWHIRLGIVVMLSHYIEEPYISSVLQRCDDISHSHYYVKMAQAWLVSAAYAKFPAITHEYLLRAKLDNWTFNKAIQKIRESYRVSKDVKQCLNNMKRK